MQQECATATIFSKYKKEIELRYKEKENNKKIINLLLF